MANAGSAKSKAFNLGTASIMIGPMAEVMDLNVKDHSVGLAKNFVIQSSDNYTDLTQGVKNNIVYSVKTGSDITATMEVYEYTPKNLTYALGLEGQNLITSENFALKEAVVGGATSLIIEGTATSNAGSLQVNDRILLQANKSGEEAQVFATKIKEVTFTPGTNPQIALAATVQDLINSANTNGLLLSIDGGMMKVTASDGVAVTMSEAFRTAFTIEDGNGSVTGTKTISASDTLTSVGFTDSSIVTISLGGTEVFTIEVKTAPVADTTARFNVSLAKPIPTTMSFGVGDRAKKINLIPVGSNEAQPMLGAKVVGILPENQEPVTLIFPKIRITNGFNIGFQTDQFSNMPFEFTPYELDETDPLYEEHKNDGLVFLMM